MSEHQRDTAFLRQLLNFEPGPERGRIEEMIEHSEHKERCVWRAVVLMAQLIALALAGLCYTGVLLQDIPPETFDLAIKVFCALSLGSFISMMAFLALWSLYRQELNGQREECRCLIKQVLHSKLETQFGGSSRTVTTVDFSSGQETAPLAFHLGGA